MAAEIILRVKVDKTQYKAFKEEVKKGLDAGGTNKVKDSLKETGEAAKSATTRIQSLGEMLTKKIAWYSISMAITSVTTAFKEALTEIKAVDKQLANIAKVSNRSIDDLQELSDKAYSTASKYGVQASQYMEAVYEYTKAGFQETADVMGELSTKAMLVGDTTASVADKFLIAANAAWKYQGNVEQLSLLVDKADYINNNYATTFDKIADGFPRVASVAAMAGMSAEQTMAALGTITATTQETASRAGTALRALILNILGDTTTEVEDGVTNTQEEIDSLRKVLEMYAGDVVKAADATGTLINPMEALSALSKAYKENKLTEKDLFLIEKGLGGKLRTNQLDALLKNFDKYNEMLVGMAGAAGTADKEIETMLTSWDAKTKVLKNTWTEFVSKGFDSKFFKDKIDWLTKLIERFDGLNEVLPLVAGAMAALFAPAIVANIEKMVKSIGNLKTAFSTGFRTLNEQTNKMELNWSAIGTAASLGITAITTAIAIYENHVRKLRQQSQERADKAIAESKAAQSNISSILDLYTAYAKAEKGSDAYKAASESLATALGEEKKAADGLADSYKTLTEERIADEITKIGTAIDETATNITNQADTWDFVKSANPIIMAAKKYDEIWESLGENDNEEFGISVTKRKVEVAFDERVKRAVDTYNAYKKEYDALEKALGAEKKEDIRWEYKDAYQDNLVNRAKEMFSTMTKNEIAERMNTLGGYLEEASYVSQYIEQIQAKAKAEKALDDFKAGKIDIDQYTEAVLDAADAEGEAVDEATALAAAQKKVADAFKEVSGQAVAASEALEKYNEAIAADQAQENADALASAAENAVQAIDKKLFDSAEVQAFADMWFSTDKIAEFKKAGINTADALMKDENFNRIFIKGKDENNETVFRDGIEAATELVNIFKEFDDDNNGLMTKDGNIMARLEETSYGTRVVVEDWKALSDQFGVTEGALKMMMNAYGLLIPGLEASTADLLAFADAAGAVAENAEGIKEIDLAKVVSEAFAQGATQDTVWELVNALKEAQENGDLKLVVDEKEVEDADTTTQELIEKLDTVVDATHIITVDDNDVLQAGSVVDVLENKLSRLDGRVFSVRFNILTGKAASGTDYAEGGATLVNEEGAELIASNGVAWIAGGGQPTVAPIPRGAKIWTAKETKAILSNSNLTPLFGGIHAFADGTSVPSEIANVPKTTLWESANLFAQDYEDDELKGLQGMVSLRKTELELLKERGGSIEEQNEKQKEIQSAIVDVVRKLQNIGGKQEDINQLAAEWYSIQSAIEESSDTQSKEQQEMMESLEKETSLRKSELSLLEAKGASNAKQVAKQREIQESLMAQVKYLKRIGGDQEEINKLLAEYYSIDKQITENEKQREEQKKQKAKDRAERMYNNLQAAIQKRMENINKKRDEELEKIDVKIKKLQEEHDLQQENQELQEKQLAVEKAREELANAKKQRTVRIFNAATGQWEWTYNASTVNAAKENLKNAKDALSEYKKEQAYQKRIDNLEAEQQEINDKYDARIAKWQAVLDTMEEPVKSIHSVLRSIEKHATEDMLPTIEKMNEALKNIGDGYVISPEVQKKMMGIGVGQTQGTFRNLGGVPVNVSGTPYGIGTQYNGDTYTFGNITLSEQQAKTTTVYQLTQMAGGLRSYAYGT